INEPLRGVYTYGQTVTYSCNEGFKLIGASERTYVIRSPRYKQCKHSLKAPPGIENGRINEPLRDVYTYGQAVTYSCMKGFKLIGASERTCSGDETFQPSPPWCQGSLFKWSFSQRQPILHTLHILYVSLELYLLHLCSFVHQ
uniref:Sushi domain-containing protein n=1 Tax=Pygocentrus nattereri TaxID=42514 RepID=A0A3B4CR12_PYGNA